MIDHAADNARLRRHMRRIIAEREIATAALREILSNPRDAASQAEDALFRIMQLPLPDERGAA